MTTCRIRGCENECEPDMETVGICGDCWNARDGYELHRHMERANWKAWRDAAWNINTDYNRHARHGMVD